jgi:hypothetical protein
MPLGFTMFTSVSENVLKLCQIWFKLLTKLLIIIFLNETALAFAKER